MSERNLPPVARTNYFSGESLLTADFVCEQQYNMQMLALVNSSLHTWGIARGLEVSWQAGSQIAQVTVSAGMAIDRLGRQIVLANSQVLKLDGMSPGSKVYLTIRYHEVYGDYSEESGVAGYKRVVQQPVLEYLRTLQAPGINILLAVITLSSQGGIDAVAYGLGTDERRYVGSRLGVLELVTEGTGINTSESLGADSDASAPSIQLKALKESDELADYLEVQASRSQFDGLLTTRDNLGVGVDQPQANLQVERITIKGTGTMSTDKAKLTLQYPIYPPLQAGDIVTPELPLGAKLPQPRNGVIKNTRSDPLTYDLVQPFKEDLPNCSYNYTRMTLVRFAAGDVGELFRIDGDGSVGLGVQSAVQSGTAGPAALIITADRKVGIALDTGDSPTAALDVNGNLLCQGTVTAKSFEGNGSKLQNLPILSYWTKQSVSSAYSNIYYDSGNVGVQMTNPSASLSVGTGRSFIGSGYVSADASDTGNASLVGDQTLFKTELSLGDSIVLGSLMQQWRQIKTIVSDSQLELMEQFPIILQQSTFAYASTGTSSMPGSARLIVGSGASSTAPATTPGTGIVSSNGVILVGDSKTQFTKELKSGDWLVIEKFAPKTTDGNNAQWLVEKVVDDTHVVVVNQSGQPIPANVSAFMVTPSLIGSFQCNVDDADSPPPPAMLLVSNGIDLPPEKSNTIAINLGLDQVDHKYALQVNGDVNFSGGSSFKDLVTDTLTVQEWGLVGGDLKVDGALSGQALCVGPASAPHAMFNANGTVSVIGSSVQIARGTFETGNISPQKPVTWKTFSGKASTDGFIVACFGPLFPGSDTPNFAGWMTCNTPSGTYWATGGTFEFSNWTNAMLNSLSAPVQKDQPWSLEIQIGASINCVVYLNIYWVPLGTNPTQQLDDILQHTSTPDASNALPFSGNAMPSVQR